MPCTHCDKAYEGKPCISNSHSPNARIFTGLQTRCPCIQCLVKISCYDKRTDCPLWKDFIDSCYINKKFSSNTVIYKEY